MWSRIRDRLGGTPSRQVPGEADTPVDTGTARSRPTGGVPDPGAGDTNSTTGTTPNEGFVGRASSDPGGAGRTGAEVRGDDDQGGAAEGRT